MYGITDASNVPKAPHRIERPFPAATWKPSVGRGDVSFGMAFLSMMGAELIASVRLMITVQMLAPIKRRMVPATANRVETQKV